jgi:hypothetical protein
MESYAVVSKDMKGKVSVRDQRKRDAGIGAVLGGVIGLIGGPVGVAAGAAAGGAVGYLTGDAVGIPRDKVESMRASLTPNSSALVVVLDDKWVQDTERGLNQAHARAAVGTMLVIYPGAGAEAITLLLSLYFIVGGLFKTFGSIALMFPSVMLWPAIWAAALAVVSLAGNVIRQRKLRTPPAQRKVA